MLALCYIFWIGITQKILRNEPRGVFLAKTYIFPFPPDFDTMIQIWQKTARLIK